MNQPSNFFFRNRIVLLVVVLVLAGIALSRMFAGSAGLVEYKSDPLSIPAPVFEIPSVVESKRENYSIAEVSHPAPAPQFVESIIPLADVTHIRTPDAVKGIYMSQCVAGTPSFRTKLVDLVNRTELNTIVIDVRDYTGRISFPTDNPVLHDMTSPDCSASDMRAFIKTLHELNIYVIGRITVFQNPYYVSLHPDEAVQKQGGGVWHDYKGLGFVDVGAVPYWSTVVELGKAAYAEGFDELNFDYIRFPSDGPMAEAVYSWDGGKAKADTLESFYKYLHDAFRPMDGSAGPVLSADLFGMVATNYDDLSIGQVLERALPYFDYIDPMVYPSHYPRTWGGFDNPAAHPYEVVKIAMDKASERTKTLNMESTKIRPWLQDFNLGATYTPERVRDQMEATYDAGLTSWLLWNAGNVYTEAALEKDQ